jgi:hypothetical protein
MTSTEICDAMNKVYSFLKEFTIIQLEEFINKACYEEAAGRLPKNHMKLMVHQAKFTIERKQRGRW